MVADRINSIIADAGLDPKYLADKIGIGEQVLSAMLSGQRQISAEEFYAICLALNMTPNELYGLADGAKEVGEDVRNRMRGTGPARS